MRRFAAIAVAAALVAGVACSNDMTPVSATGGVMRAINASPTAVDVQIDGVTRVHALGIAAVSDTFSVRAGTHSISYIAAGRTQSVATTFTANAGDRLASFVASLDAASNALGVIADTGAIVPANKSKLRVTNLAASLGTRQIMRTQPDFPSPVSIMTPFAYQATSPYLQSDPGVWEVFVTPAGGGANVATTGAIDIPAGQRRTVVLLDSAGVLTFKVFE